MGADSEVLTPEAPRTADGAVPSLRHAQAAEIKFGWL
jgi:hypothetical protein